MPKVSVVMVGCPVKSDREPLGISTIVLIQGKFNTLYDVGTFATRQHVLNGLKAHGLTFGDIDRVILSHLHWDHALYVDPFREAEIIVSSKEHAQASDEKARDGATPMFMVDILKGFKMKFPTEDEEIEPGVQLLETPGHTAGFLSAIVDDGAETHIIAGDALPHACCLVSGVHERGWFSQEMADRSMRKLGAMKGTIYPAHDRPFRYDAETKAVNYLQPYSITFTCRFHASGEATTVMVSS
jgi:glyoxylase-like metal-dependent hydrolase (beta-lactamase superfamily II)